MPLRPRNFSVLRLWGPVMLYVAGITWLSHQPSLAPPGGVPDWLAHGLEYAGLGALVGRALAGSGRLSVLAWALGAVCCAAAGALDEAHQSFVPGRNASAGDLAADAAGAALGLAAAGLIQAWRGRRAAQGEVELTLYGRRGCHLCDEAEKAVREAAAGLPVRLLKIDVDSDPELKRAYGDQVPVVAINGRRSFKFRVDPERLRRKLLSLQGRRSP